MYLAHTDAALAQVPSSQPKSVYLGADLPVNAFYDFFFFIVYSSLYTVHCTIYCTEEFTALYLVNNARMCAPCCQVTFRKIVMRVSSSATIISLSKSIVALSQHSFLLIKILTFDKIII